MDGQQSTRPHPLIISLRDLYANLDRSIKAVQPAQFVMATKMTFPQFAQTGSHGQPMQQDAEEFYSNVLTVIGEEMSGPAAIRSAFREKSVGDEELMGATNVIDALLGIKVEETLTCDELASAATTRDEDAKAGEAPAVEPPVVRYDLQRKLVCNIQGGVEQNTASKSGPPVNINHIAEGIRLAMSGKIEKHSDILGRNAVWTKTQRIARLPPYLAVQFGRFYWKVTPDSQDHSGVKCKVMKPVSFDSTLDLYEFCTPKIQEILKIHRNKALQEEEERLLKKQKQGSDSLPENTAMEISGEEAKDDVDGIAADEAEAAALREALALSLETEQPPVGPGLPDEFQGFYELFAVVTHKGRDADGGHYMGWVKADDNGDNWYVFDDDECSPCKTEDVLKLKGGGDWHMSYLNFYRAMGNKK
jgi:ubiquitin carboxyl-terminal hydrolase 14